MLKVRLISAKPTVVATDVNSKIALDSSAQKLLDGPFIFVVLTVAASDVNSTMATGRAAQNLLKVRQVSV